MRAVIVGGGIAGLAAALALDRIGAQSSVHEAHPRSGEDIGAFLTIAGNGIRALDRLGAAERVAEAGFELTDLRLSGPGGEVLADRRLDTDGDPLSRFRCLRRADLRRALHDEALSRGVRVRQRERFTSARSDGHGGVAAVFSGGGEATGDVLLGADGLGSSVRGHVAPGHGGAAGCRYAGQNVYYGYTREHEPPHARGRIDMIRGTGWSFGYTVSPEGEVFWFARLSARELARGELSAPEPGAWARRLVPALGDAPVPVRIVEATGDRVMATNAHDVPPGGPWRRGRALLIGDAAHAASPATGQGASMAAEDAVVLAKALRDNPGADAALAAYERARRHRVEENVRRSHAMSRERPVAPADPETARREEEALARALDWDTPLAEAHTDPA
ncbi:FAD-dependent monooxygenase [Nocardiopsis sp. RSe5-2]|uniref:FAD-dependent monooxygenase n=1 Tax=Nocardiopsis endophytica TaxID=3018445 RepID=A0ABT4U144_9ACTN|nr:FAD-dependent monooxygenase [Nocardiopsis endophytica]MDA2810668.1 FAD-dependent monooxygenase [Nocardiopsis endophytica]